MRRDSEGGKLIPMEIAADPMHEITPEHLPGMADAEHDDTDCGPVPGPPIGPVGRYIRRPVTRSELDREAQRLA